MSRRVRVRFAPSPTGPLHPGGIRTALYNYLLAKKHGGDFILRIEDTDQTRFVPGAEEFIIEALKWCGIEPNEGVGFGDGPYAPYRQSERKHLYRQFADKLIESGHAYYAFDTEEEIEKMRQDLAAQGVQSPSYNAVTRQYMKNSLTLPGEEVERRLAEGTPYVIRFKMPRNEEVKFYDEIRGWVTFNTSQLTDAVLLKSDGMPTYHLANVSDDYMMQITHVIRGEEWLSSTPLHVLLYRALGLEEVMPKFAHLPLILKPDGTGKLSKRDGDRLGFPFYAIRWKNPETGEVTDGYREKGFLPEAFVNFLALLGWSPGENRRKMSMQEMIQLFSLDRVHKAGARYDYNMLLSLNHEYLMATDDKVLAATIRPQLEQRGIPYHEEYVTGFCRLMKERAHFASELLTLGYYFFEDVKTYDTDTLRKKYRLEQQPLFDELTLLLENTDDFSAPALEKKLKEFLAAHQLKTGDVMPVLRIALAGTMQGPAVFDMMALMGKEKTVQRLKNAWVKFRELV
ncbi:MAG: glutamate--tRNA ligase [Chitinophagales bacterium]|nr:glutamate--tRNA ligase [Chitinophagales bacterium]MDW8418705.1 glutamate--tRNA ligase [Chitinophagales bacterium]